MASKTANIHFFRFTFEKVVSNPSDNFHRTNALSIDETKILISEIVGSYTDIGSNKYAKKLNDGSVLEIISQDNSVIFAKIGHQNPSNTLACRNEQTLSSNPVHLEENQFIETFTYFLMDISTGIIAYLNLFNTPKVSCLKDFFNTHQGQQNIYFTTSIILEEDTLRKIMSKDMISSIKLTVAIPSDDVLDESLGINREDFISLEDLQYKNVSYTFSAKRNKKLFSNSSSISTFIEKIHNKYNDISKFKVNARNEDEKSMEYDLLTARFTKSADLGVQNVRDLDEDGFRSVLFDAYNNSRDELIRLTRR